jgi:hypothetical protein
MQLDRNSVNAGYAAAMKRMTGELEEFKQQVALDYFELRRELDAALQQVRETRLEFLNYKAAVVHDRAQLAEVNRLRMLTQAQLVERDPLQPLQ